MALMLCRLKKTWQSFQKVVKIKPSVEKFLTNVKNLNTKQSAASAAVRYETGNFPDLHSAEARPRLGVPKAFWRGIPVPVAERE
jgi:hypothetical protein